MRDETSLRWWPRGSDAWQRKLALRRRSKIDRRETASTAVWIAAKSFSESRFDYIRLRRLRASVDGGEQELPANALGDHAVPS